jgi:hypothetical protein
VTLWSDDEAREKSAEPAERLSSIAAIASGANLEAIDNLDVSIVELVPNSHFTA